MRISEHDDIIYKSKKSEMKEYRRIAFKMILSQWSGDQTS